MKLSFLSMALPLAGLFSGVFSSPVSPLDSLDVTKTDTAQYTKTTEIAQATSTESKNIGTWVVDLSSQSNKTVANIQNLNPKDNNYEQSLTSEVTQLVDFILSAVESVSNGTLSILGITPGLVGTLLQIVHNLVQVIIASLRLDSGYGLVEKLLDAVAKLVSGVGATLTSAIPVLLFLQPVFDLVAGILVELGHALRPL